MMGQHSRPFTKWYIIKREGNFTYIPPNSLHQAHLSYNEHTIYDTPNFPSLFRYNQHIATWVASQFSEYDSKYYWEILCTIKKGLSRKVYCNYLTNRCVNIDWFSLEIKNIRYLILENVRACINFAYFVIIFVIIL